MAVKRSKSNINVVDAAIMRIKNVFSNGVPVYFSTSGGKDSIVCCDIIYNLIVKKEIDPKQLTVIFIDEEAIYDCCIESVKSWRKKFLLVGAQFCWYCLPFKQMSCFHQLENTESWITWDPRRKEDWIRQPPNYAITYHPLLATVGQMNYQTFIPKICKDGIMMTGVRAAESIQRLQYMAQLNIGKKGITGSNTIYPIYDWKDTDVWLYIRDHKVDIPEAYLWLYQSGIDRHSLRISNFFSADTVLGLRHVAETDPNLWARIERREPNSYMIMLYWDSEMYKRSTAQRKKLEASEPPKDYKALCRKMLFEEPQKYFTNKNARTVAKRYRTWFIKCDGMARPRDYKKAYEALVAGDPKTRSLRAIYQDVFGAYAEYSKRFRKSGGNNG